MRFDIENLEGTIKHPDFPEIEVYVRKPDEVEKMAYYTMLSQFEIPVAVLNPTDNAPLYELVRDEKGEIQKYPNEQAVMRIVVQNLQTVPVQAMVKFLKDHIIGWKGFLTRGNMEINYDASKLHLVFNPRLGVKGEKNPEDKTPFFMFLLDKIVDDKTYNPDPLD